MCCPMSNKLSPPMFNIQRIASVYTESAVCSGVRESLIVLYVNDAAAAADDDDDDDSDRVP